MLALRDKETVLFPAPYVAGDVVPLVVTSQRVLKLDGNDRLEMEATAIEAVARHSRRPLLFLSLFLIVAGLPLVAYGAWGYWQVRAMPSFEEQPPVEENPPFEDPFRVRIVSGVEGGVGALIIALGVWSFRRRRHAVICRSGPRTMRLPVLDEPAQTQVLMTIQAIINSGKAMAQSAPPPRR
jgi:hypothetical protein